MLAGYSCKCIVCTHTNTCNIGVRIDGLVPRRAADIIVPGTIEEFPRHGECWRRSIGLRVEFCGAFETADGLSGKAGYLSCQDRRRRGRSFSPQMIVTCAPASQPQSHHQEPPL
jgi:hypothetical protein